MMRYTFNEGGTSNSWEYTACNKEEALRKFSKKNEAKFSFTQTASNSKYTLDEWSGNGPHWTHPTIQVYWV